MESVLPEHIEVNINVGPNGSRLIEVKGIEYDKCPCDRYMYRNIKYRTQDRKGEYETTHRAGLTHSESLVLAH